jgi:hypothetical protein
MKHKLINHTTISRKVINELIQFACPKGVNNFVASVMYDKGGAAFWGHISQFERPKKVRIYIDEKNKYPRLSHNRNLKKVGYYPVFFIRNDYEAILSLFAHELRHLWQGKNIHNRKKFWNGKLCNYIHWDGKHYTTVYKMEKDACEYTQKVLFRYRKLRGKHE